MTMLQFQFGAKQPIPSFAEKVGTILSGPLTTQSVKVLQVNLGYICNMACRHCHLGAGPGRTETMSSETVQKVLKVVQTNPIETLDLTGGAPEMNTGFRDLVKGARKAGKRVIVRTNLTILFEPGAETLAEFYDDQGVELIASLPCYLEANITAVRGSGAFEKSINALRLLNKRGFGIRPDKVLNLVYNPAGASLPPDQDKLEQDYKRELQARYGIAFTRLFTFTNMPIGRFRDSLQKSGAFESYMSMLSSAFNPAALENVMCRSLLNVGWDGRLYDCDFNQATGIGLSGGLPNTIREFDYSRLATRTISLDDHCFGCTAGQGSS